MVHASEQCLVHSPAPSGRPGNNLKERVHGVWPAPPRHHTLIFKKTPRKEYIGRLKIILTNIGKMPSMLNGNEQFAELCIPQF